MSQPNSNCGSNAYIHMCLEMYMYLYSYVYAYVYVYVYVYIYMCVCIHWYLQYKVLQFYMCKSANVSTAVAYVEQAVQS